MGMITSSADYISSEPVSPVPGAYLFLCHRALREAAVNRRPAIPGGRAAIRTAISRLPVGLALASGRLAVVFFTVTLPAKKVPRAGSVRWLPAQEVHQRIDRICKY